MVGFPVHQTNASPLRDSFQPAKTEHFLQGSDSSGPAWSAALEDLKEHIKLLKMGHGVQVADMRLHHAGLQLNVPRHVDAFGV